MLPVGGLIPLWTAFLIMYMNRSRSRSQPPRIEAPPEDEYPYDYEEPEVKPCRSLLGAIRGINLGALIGEKVGGLSMERKRFARRCIQLLGS